MRSKYFYLLVVVAISLSLLISGCGMIAQKATEKATEKAIENSTGGAAKVDLSKKDGSVEIKTNEGSFKSGGTNEWPNSIPSDVPKFTFGKITSVSETNTPQGKNISVGFENITVDSFDKYKSELESSGWKMTMTTKSDDGYLIMGSKEKRSVMASFSNKTGAVIYSEETPKP